MGPQILSESLSEKVRLLEVLSRNLLRMKLLIYALPVLLEFDLEEVPNLVLGVLYLSLNVLNKEFLASFKNFPLLLRHFSFVFKFMGLVFTHCITYELI